MGILCILSGFIFAVVSLFLPYPGSVSCMVIALVSFISSLPEDGCENLDK